MSRADSLVPFHVNIDVGAATREYSFIAPYTMQCVELQSSADAADGTDKYTATVKLGSVTLMTGSTVTSADAVDRKIGPDAGQTGIIGAGDTFKIVITFAGTAANVTGVNVTLWAIDKR